jgi:MFS family permease
MLADKQELFDNWSILVIAFFLIFFAFGVPTYSLPYMYGPAMDEFGWSNAQVNLLSTAKFLIGAVAALGMGIMVDKIGGKVAVLVGAFTGGVALALFLFATTLPVYYLAGGVLGLSASSIVAAMKVVVSRLFTLNQGLAMGIVLCATSVGGVVMPLVWPPLLESGMNWRMIAAVMSLGSFLVATPLWLIFMARTGNIQTTINASTAQEAGKGGMWSHFLEISKDKGFWLIAIGIFLASAVDQAMMQNYVNFLRTDKGISLASVGWAGSFAAVIGVAAKIGSGWFYDYFSVTGIRITYFLLALSVFLGLPVAGMLSLFLFMLVRGIAHGGMIVEAPILTKHYLGPRNLGMTIGIISVFINLGFAAGPPMLGYFADIIINCKAAPAVCAANPVLNYFTGTEGNFTMGLVVYSALAFVSTLLLVPVKPKFWTPPSKRRKQESEVGVANLRPARV